MIAIVDYGMANLRSVERALAKVGGEPVITGDAAVIARADQVVLPGVGAFCACMTNLDNRDLTQAVRRSMADGKPFLGICVGMQMLFQSSSEMGDTPGMGVFAGRVVRFFEGDTAENHLKHNANGHSAKATDGDAPSVVNGLKVPHIGWNALQFPRPSRLFAGLDAGARVYFVHSYYPKPHDADTVSATSDYGADFCCAVERDNIVATQFHPEKSGDVGLHILRNFVRWQ